MNKVRTRFAPSPTGRMHVGNLRTALYAYLIAKHEDGDFMLRIEDTDQERFVDGALDIIYRTLEKTGLIHDEGPDKDGGVGPYVQSERNASGLYLKYAKQLIEQGDAYYCFCDKERLESLRTSVSENGVEIVNYDKHCLHLSKEEIEANLAEGKPYVIRINMPTEGITTFHDEIYGDISVPNAELDDMILIKSDGYPTYNFANVIDDHLMGITHVVRGNEYLSSAPKYNRLYEAFGWEVPVYVHCPLITDENHKKLSKRCGHSSYEDLLEQGYVSEAIVNYVALLGWCPEGTQEIFSLPELVKEFDYRHMSKSPAVFDTAKLKWMNGEYLKSMDFDTFYELAEPYLKEVITKDLDLKKIAALVKTRIEILPDIKEQVDFFEELPEYDTAMYCHKKMKTNEETSLEALKEILPKLEACDDYSNDALFLVLKSYVEEKGCKNGFIMWPVRTAVSGKQNTPGGATEIMEILGKEESLARIKKAIEMLS
ncbi:glutamate--tRNA ligase [Bariatricus massiliensis]|uniref:Glutamate--tRNA ligase n=1 Tax=Bariatricus massiliensis TaxID=1745713 RepID=A0ABS8DCR0_9FIRM|nr:glutamate--tRNA ligase [Bariatricus massiliensis]MCB7303399.1 glutamate--tRNA ligase [Bariatricus massiliensis]MCB7373531.1 glutamate--tRNA ligase [Bariatricus massiliensis]MCB7386201.1 glutamate--tRNA ligase [Bariatricus massiliensis]MCB7410363.1 glutamate--tRNA ligase [Bariatricus massiliensis]MCQ5252353.1 glutamate--tRNA ligase [Bariatricus massiliensis]